MGEKDWRVEGVMGLLSLLVIVVFVEFFIANSFKTKINNDFKDIAAATTVYIQSMIDGIQENVDIFDIPDTVSYYDDNMIVKYLKIWTESNSFINKISFIRTDNNILSYSINNDITKADLSTSGFIYDNASYSLNTEPISSYEDKKIFFTKALYRNQILQGVLVCEVPFETVFQGLSDLSLTSSLYNIVVQDMYSNVVFDGSPLDDSYDINEQFDVDRFNSSWFTTFINTFNIIDAYKNAQSVNNITAEGQLSSNFAKVTISSDLNNTSYFLNRRIVFYSIAIIVVVFICMIVINYQLSMASRTKIYALAALAIQALLLIMTFIETTNIMHTYNRSFIMQANIMAETIDTYKESQENVVSLVYALLTQTDEYKYDTPGAFDKLVNDYYINLKLKSSNYKSICLLKGNGYVDSYPKDNDTIYNNFRLFRKNINNIYTYYSLNDSSFIEYRRIDDTDYYIAFENMYLEYDKVDSTNKFISIFDNVNEDGDVLSLDEIYKKLTSENIVYNIHDRILLAQKFEDNKCYGVICGRNANNKIIHIYQIETENHVDDLIIVGLCSFLLVFIVEVLIYANVIRIRNKKREYEDSLREENRSLDKLLAKINDDVLDVNRTFKFDDDIE